MLEKYIDTICSSSFNQLENFFFLKKFDGKLLKGTFRKKVDVMIIFTVDNYLTILETHRK